MKPGPAAPSRRKIWGRGIPLEPPGPPREKARQPMLKTLFSRKTNESADFYSPVMLGPETLLRAASRTSTIHDMLGVIGKLSPDDYTRYLTEYCGEGLRRYPESWYYADISTVLLTAGRFVGPRTYL